MKRRLLALLFSGTAFLTYGQEPSGCGSSGWPSNVSLASSGEAFTVPAGAGAGWTYRWVVTSGLQIVSGQTSNVAYIKGLNNGTAGQVYVVRYKDGISACSDRKKVFIGDAPPPPPSLCTASVYQIWCAPAAVPGMNAEINAQVNVSNPFSHTASVVVQWDPDYFTGFQEAGGFAYLNAYQSTMTSTQFEIAANTSSSSGFYVPMIAKYTDLTTGEICIVKLNPLVATPCGGPHMRPANPESVEETVSAALPQQQRIIVSPNPTDKMIRFSVNEPGNYKVSIFDPLGNMIIKDHPVSKELNLEKQGNGIYLYIITDESGFIQRGKIIKN